MLIPETTNCFTGAPYLGLEADTRWGLGKCRRCTGERSVHYGCGSNSRFRLQPCESGYSFIVPRDENRAVALIAGGSTTRTIEPSRSPTKTPSSPFDFTIPFIDLPYLRP